MTRTTEWWQHPNGRWRFRLRTWLCCGLMWEVLLSPRYPEREGYNVTCLKCGSTVDKDTT